MVNRHTKDLYMPGRQTPGKPEIIRFNEAVQETWNEIQNRRRELTALLAKTEKEIELAKSNIAFLLIERCDIQEDSQLLAALRMEAEAIHLAIEHLDNKSTVPKRQHTWLTSQ